MRIVPREQLFIQERFSHDMILSHPMETLGKHFQHLTKAAFERHGFAQADLLSQWQAIVGDEVAAIARPEKIKWPRQAEAGQRAGGTLIVRAEPGRSLDLHYHTTRMMNRINQYFGYEAVVAVKIMAATGAGTPPETTKSAVDPATIRPQLSGIEEPDLQDALSRLGAGIIAKSRSPQAK